MGGKRNLATRLCAMIDATPHKAYIEPFVEELRWLIASRAEFDRQNSMDPRPLTDIERAVRFHYLQRLAFGGRVDSRHFGVRRDQGSRINLGKLRAELKLLRDRLAPVTIEQFDYAGVIRRYDGANAILPRSSL